MIWQILTPVFFTLAGIIFGLLIMRFLERKR